MRRPGYLDAFEVAALVGPADAVRIVRETFADTAAGRAVASAPPALGLSLGGRAAKVKAATAGSAAGVRVAVSTDAGLTSHCVLFDPADGRVVAVVDETALHRLRTAASAAVVLDQLRPGVSAASATPLTVALVGTGRIADEVPAVLAAVGGVEALHVSARSADSARSFVARHADTPLALHAHADLAAATADADVIILLTAAAVPFLAASNVRPGLTVLGLGGGAEIAADVLAAVDRFFVDDLEFALTTGSLSGWLRAGVPVDQVRSRVTGSVGDLVSARTPGRTAPDQSVLAVVQGLAACDVALAAFAWERATA